MQNALQVNDQLSSKELFASFKKQLAKDFEQSNFDADFHDLEPDFSGICEKIVVELQRSEKKADARLMQLLNRIDISEAQWRKHITAQQHKDHLMAIAELIIKRVLQKVVIKHYYKRKEKD
jgi:hypothetical protein